ncbi:hypothetical protein QCA50_002398 [Cerrena zonata]|uniref:Pyridoxamine 5'-phosphate oxidase Alr4036 family FMN-binding domain-containing protein n=1 Tax=Cerrena zonata TaxID=2478898 RepID=A0AAW0GWU9_9APHY
MAAQPRWFQALTKALSLPENKGKTIYQLATVDSHNIPHVRSVGHRDFLIPKTYPAVPVLLATTDVRAAKVTQSLSNSVAELAWWLEGSQDQFRIAGKVTIIPAPSHPFHTMNAIPKGSAIHFLDEGGDKDHPGKYDWEKKRREVYDSMSPYLKASWTRPPPGSAINSYDDAKAWPQKLPKLGEAESEEDKRNAEIAFGNFALVLIEPHEIDWIQLGIFPHQRTRFTRLTNEGNGDEWKEEIQVP